MEETLIAGEPSNARSIEVVGLGQCALDILGRVGSFPEPDSKVELSQSLIQGGGPVATALVTLSRLGVATAFLGRTGDDDFGCRIREGLVAEGVDCTGLRVDPGRSSQFAFIAVEEGTARRTIFWTRGSVRPLAAGEVDTDLIRRVRVLHLDGLQREASLAAARVAREAGVTTVLDGGTWREGTEELLPLIDHLVVSERFARHLADDPGESLPRLLGWGARAATVTLGEQGCHVLTREGNCWQQPAFAVAAVDTTGCGDVFHGGYLYGLLQEWPLERTVRFAAACAALKARCPGGRTGIPGRAEVDDFLTANSNHQG